MFDVSRDEARQFWFTAWRKHKANEILTPIETLALDIMVNHPEFHTMLENPADFKNSDWTPEGGAPHPFLHLGLHLAVREQVSIDQPFGIREAYTQLARKLDSALEADHIVGECLAEQIWQMQRNKQAFSSEKYLADIRKVIR
jgi:hypothetical protein